MHTEQLQVLVKNLRSEAGHSLSIAQGVNTIDTLKYLLQRTQEELWTAFVWPELKLRVTVPLVAGQYGYPFPATMPFDSVREVWTAETSADMNWTPVAYGITDEDMILDDGTNSTRQDPAEYWDNDPLGFRIWPTPDTARKLRFVGQKPLGALVSDADVSTLDATCIVLFAASELLARAKAEDAAGKLQKAQRHLQKLLGNKVSAKMKVSTLGGGSPARSGRGYGLTFGRGF